MRTKRVLRYYCDHCRKGSCGKASMAKHEARCIHNPERTCGFCEIAGLATEPIADLKKALEDGDLAGVLEKSSGCPACVLAAIVQSRHGPHGSYGDGDRYFEFDYKAQVAKFRNEHPLPDPMEGVAMC